MTLLVALSLLAVVTAVTCSLPGVFLVVRRQSMLVEAMSHAVFPGIVIGALLSGSARSPWMVVLATAMGLVIVVGADRARESGLVTADASQGIIFPVLFAIGIALLSTQLSSVHLSEAAVLSGELNLLALPTQRWIIGTTDLGPQAMWVLLAVFAAAGLGAVALIRGLGEFVTFPNSGNQLVWTIETQITRQLSSSLSSWLDPLWYGYLGLMIVGLVVAVAKGVRKPA